MKRKKIPVDDGMERDAIKIHIIDSMKGGTFKCSSAWKIHRHLKRQAT